MRSPALIISTSVRAAAELDLSLHYSLPKLFQELLIEAKARLLELYLLIFH